MTIPKIIDNENFQFPDFLKDVMPQKMNKCSQSIGEVEIYE